MRPALKIMVLALVYLLGAGQAFAKDGFPIQLSEPADAEALARQLLGPSVKIVPGSAKLIGSSSAVGTFTGAQGILPFNKGVVFSTSALPTNSNGQSPLEALGQPGDAQLSQILGLETFDAVVLEFEFVSSESEVAVPYVFGTDEFPNFVGTEFNDGFAFLINGTNIALVPGTNDLVSVNTINSQQNSQFFTDNTQRTVLINLNGLAGLAPNELVAIVQVVPGETNKIRIVIADASDAILTSAVALGGLVLAIPATAGSEVTSAILTHQILTQLSYTQTTHIASVLKTLFGKKGKPVTPTALRDEGDDVVPVAHGYMHTGQSAGESGFPYPWGLWGNYQHIFSEDDFPTTAFDADTDQLTVGVDLSPWDNFLAGVSLSYEVTDMETVFNRGEEDIDGFSVVPYLGAYLSDSVGVDFDLTMDLSIGYSIVDFDQFRTNFFGDRVTSTVDAERWFASANLTASQAFGNWYVSGRTGLLVAKEEQDAFVESDLTPVDRNNIQFGQVNVGGEIAYLWDEWDAGTFEPFVGAAYQYEFEHEDTAVELGPQPANDDDEVLVSLGVRFYGRENVSATFMYDKVLAREDFDSDSISFFLRAEF